MLRPRLAHGFPLIFRCARCYSYWQAVWPPGRYLAWPWLGVSHLVTQKSVVFDTVVRGCKTKGDVTLAVDAALAFRIMGDASKVSGTQTHYH